MLSKWRSKYLKFSRAKFLTSWTGRDKNTFEKKIGLTALKITASWKQGLNTVTSVLPIRTWYNDVHKIILSLTNFK